MTEKKIKKLYDLRKTVESLKKNGQKIVFTNGCFDVLHKGHIKLLKKAKSFGDILVVAINSDSSVKKIKGNKRPISRARDRAIVLSAIEAVDYVTTFDEPDPARVIMKLNPDVLVKGGDWDKKEIVGSEYVKSKGGKVYSVPLSKGCSTTSIINRIIKSTG